MRRSPFLFLSVFRLFGELHRARFAYYVHLYLAGVFKLRLYALHDLLGHYYGIGIVHVFGLDDYTYLAACLYCKGLIHALERVRDFLQLFKALDIIFKRFAPCAGTRRAYGIRRLNKHGLDRCGFNVAMVRLDGVDDDGVLLVLSGKLDAQLDVAAFHLVVDRFA